MFHAALARAASISNTTSHDVGLDHASSRFSSATASLTPLLSLGVANVTTTHWWEPGKSENVIPGILLEAEEHGWELHLDGTFEEQANAPGLLRFPLKGPNSYPILVGTDNQGHQISLLDCQVLQRSLNLLPLSRGSMKVWPTVVVHGVHFENAEDFRLMSLSVRYSHVDTWAGTHGFTVSTGTDFYPVEVRYNKPDPVECTLSDGLKVSIDFSVSGPVLPLITHLEITQRSWLKVASSTPLPFMKLLEYVSELANVIALAVGQPLTPLQMSATCNAQDQSGDTKLVSVELVYNRKPLARFTREVSYVEMLFTLPQVRSRFGELIKAWFTRDEAFRSLCTLYFGTMRSPFMYVEHRFLNMFQALESFDRRTFQPAVEKMQKHEERLRRILESVTESKDRKWLEQKLRHSHEPNAADRIKHLVEKLDAGWLLTQTDIDLSADLRNYYTHFDPTVEARLPSHEKRIRSLSNLAARLRVLCELVLLDALGFPSEQVREQVKATRHLERHLVATTELE